MDSRTVYPAGPRFSREFLSRRLHSLAGIAFLLFLCEHLFTNSQATLFLGDDGKGFVRMVNFIHSLPYLQVIELTFIGLPLFVHTWWGIERLRSAKINSIPSDGKTASLPYSRNIAFTWQRITSVLLIVAIGLHVYYMRFVKEPETVSSAINTQYFVKVSMDPGLYTLAPRLNLRLFDAPMLDHAKLRLSEEKVTNPDFSLFKNPMFNADLAQQVKEEERIELEKRFVAGMRALNPAQDEVVALCDTFGTATLMMIRDTFKSVWLCVVYSVFVIMACFHGCNGLWTFAITWGVTLSERSRVFLRIASNSLMAALIFFGLACIWGVYWINLRF